MREQDIRTCAEEPSGRGHGARPAVWLICLGISKEASEAVGHRAREKVVEREGV